MIIFNGNKFKNDIGQLIKEYKYRDIEFTIKEKDLKKDLSRYLKKGLVLLFL
jgi:hypothetical protein